MLALHLASMLERLFGLELGTEFTLPRGGGYPSISGGGVGGGGSGGGAGGRGADESRQEWCNRVPAQTPQGKAQQAPILKGDIYRGGYVS